MILYYKVNMAGPNHIFNNISCQDSYCIKLQNDDCIMAAVADGVGSELFSDLGSRVISNFSVNYCVKNYNRDAPTESSLEMIKDSFAKAYAKIKEVAARKAKNIDQCNSTLCLVVYDGEKNTLYYGHSGDSGLIAVKTDGTYYKVTEQQRDTDGAVYPLCAGAKHWVFGCVENVAGALLMTDGIWEHICPPLLSNEEQPINIAFAEMFLNHYSLTSNEIKIIEKSANDFFAHLAEEKLNDDKTLIAIMNKDSPPKRLDAKYYYAPDWEAIYLKKYPNAEKSF